VFADHPERCAATNVDVLFVQMQVGCVWRVLAVVSCHRLTSIVLQASAPMGVVEMQMAAQPMGKAASPAQFVPAPLPRMFVLYRSFAGLVLARRRFHVAIYNARRDATSSHS